MAGLFGDIDEPTAMGLLAMSGVLGTPVSRGGGVGPAFSAYGQGYQSAQDALMRRLLMQSQIAENDANRKMNKRYITVGKNLYDTEAGKFLDIPGGDTTDLPANVREWMYYSKLTPEQQLAYQDMRRQNYSNAEIAGVQSTFRRGPVVNGQPPPVNPLSTLPAEVAAAAAKRGAESRAAETGKAAGTAESRLAGVDQQRQIIEDTVNALKTHEGQKWAVGVPLVSQAPDWVTIGGTSHADFLAKYKQAQGQVFLQGYETLKGGGQITEIEGAQAKAAIAAMDRAQSKSAFNKALDDYLRAYNAGIAKLKAQSKLVPSPSAIESQMTPEAIRQVGEQLMGLPPPNNELSDLRKKYGLK